jgi:cytochrome c-type biogenesis protein CcmF
MNFRANIKGNGVMGTACINTLAYNNGPAYFETGIAKQYPFPLYLLNIILILVVTAITFGTLAPIIFYFLIGRDISIGESFFIKTTIPFIPNILLLLNKSKVKVENERMATSGSILEILGIFIILRVHCEPMPLFYSFLLSLIIGLACQNRSNFHLGHYGLLLGILGVILNDINKVEIISQIGLCPNQFIVNLPHSDNYLVFRGAAAAHGPNYFSLYGGLITKGGAIALYPEKRYYYTQNLLISKIEIHSNLISDLYCYLGEGNILNGWNLKIIYNPYQILIWLGPLVSILGIIKEYALSKRSAIKGRNGSLGEKGLKDDTGVHTMFRPSAVLSGYNFPLAP